MIVWILSGLLIVQTVFFLFVINKLVNKIMSRDYQSYSFKEPKYEAPKLQETDPAMDLGSLEEIKPF